MPGIVAWRSDDGVEVGTEDTDEPVCGAAICHAGFLANRGECGKLGGDPVQEAITVYAILLVQDLVKSEKHFRDAGGITHMVALCVKQRRWAVNGDGEARRVGFGGLSRCDSLKVRIEHLGMTTTLHKNRLPSPTVW